MPHEIIELKNSLYDKTNNNNNNIIKKRERKQML